MTEFETRLLSILEQMNERLEDIAMDSSRQNMLLRELHPEASEVVTAKRLANFEAMVQIRKDLEAREAAKGTPVEIARKDHPSRYLNPWAADA